MSHVKLCRICVQKDVKMYEHDRFQLKFYYEEVTGFRISKSDRLPKWFCFECAALLHKFCEFRRKCFNGQNILKHLLETGCVTSGITRKTQISSIQPLLQIITASENKAVKTYTVKHSKIIQNKAHKKNNIHKYFTEVFVDDVKTVVDPEISHNLITIDKITTNTEYINNDDFNDDMTCDESNDSIPLVNNINVDENLDKNEKDCNFEKLTVTNCSKTISAAPDKQNFDFKLPNHDTEIEINDIERKDCGTERIYNTDKADDSIEIPANDGTEALATERSSKTHKGELINPDQPNLDNKFQRSVKKKFLDENHWTKITLTDEEASRRFQAKAYEQKYLTADFKCTDCFRTFSQEDMMKRHIKLRHCESLGPNECRHCHMRFKWKSRLQKHLKEHYNIYKCLRCELSFPVEISAFQHDYSHNGVTWTCSHCGQGFRHSSTYYTHLRKHKSKYVCTLCGVSFVSEFGLFMHRRVKHVINQDSKDKEESSNTYCNVCDIKFDTLKGFEEHFAESALHATEVVDGASLPLKTRCTKKRVPRISTNCTLCTKTFSTYAAFSKHHLSCHSALPLPKSRDNKQEGQRQICEVCGVTLASSWSLVNHLNTHSRDKRYTCKTCGMQLSSRSVLQRHQLTHSHEKIFECDMCEKGFVNRSGLKLHLRKHDKNHATTTRNKKRNSESLNVMDYFKYGPLATSFK